MKLVLLGALLLIAGVLAERESAEISTKRPERINWLPVWDTDQKPGDARQLIRNSISSVYPNPALPLFPLNPQSNLGACDAPNGLGINNLFKQAKELLPRERLRRIIQSAAKDPQVQALYRLVRTPEYKERTANFSRSREYRGYRSYVCYKMNCDMKLYIEFVKNLVQLPELEEPPKEEIELYEGRAGWRGILADIRDALPRQQLLDLFQRLKETDWYLIRAVQTSQSYEYEAISRIVQLNSDYEYLSQALAGVGFPLDELKQLVYVALGWRSEPIEPIEAIEATDDLLQY